MPLGINRFREKQYQLNADRHNDACIKFDRLRQTARYFELESSRAKQFNAWNLPNAKEPKCLEILRKAESLRARRSRLQDLLVKDEEIYKRECEQLKLSSSPRVRFPLKAIGDRSREKLEEENRYYLRNSPRIQSYFCGTLPESSQEYYPSKLKGKRSELRRKTFRMSLERTNLRNEHDDVIERINNENDLEQAQDGYNERMDEYKENSRIARASNLYGMQTAVPKDGNHSTKYVSRPAAGLSTESSEPRPRSRILHDSHFILGNQTYLQEEGSYHKGPNPKFTDRYAHRSLESTNVGETSAHSMDNDDGEEPGQFEECADEIDEGRHEIDEKLTNEEHHQKEELVYKSEFQEVANGRNENEESAVERNASPDTEYDEQEQQQQRIEQVAYNNERNEQQQNIDREVVGKASAGRSDHRDFESEKSLPWLRMIPGDKNLSEQMFLYLTHNELKARIQDLEKRENQACSKHQWDEALRLRDMRNRLDLARERNLYRRDDLMLDPEIKKLGMAGIEARDKLLKEREDLCTNSSMYSEEAKQMWDKWVIEDQKSILEEVHLRREDLMKELEENWRSLAVEDKQRISDLFKDKKIIDVALEDVNDSSVIKAAGR